MSLAPKVETYCHQHNLGTKLITIDGSDRACINCIWYEQYFRKNRGNLAGLVCTSIGWCIKREERRGALRQPCRDYEKKEDFQ